MKITDLNNDCLWNIFEYLDFSDLLNVASSNQRLNDVANIVYERKHRSKYLYFRNLCLSQDRIIQIEKYSIKIGDLQTSLQFIRCFGYLISSIEFTFLKQKNASKFDQRAIHDINEYCSDSLRFITIVNCPNGLEHLKRPFSKVARLTLIEPHITVRNSLNRLFPKIEVMELESHFDGDELSSSECCVENMALILRSCQQVLELKIKTNQPFMDSINFRNAIGSFKNLKRLTFYVETLSTNSIENVVHLENVEVLTIYNTEYNFCNTIDIMEIPFSFGQLKTLIIRYYHNLNAGFFNFIDKHSKIQNLIIDVLNLSDMDLSKIATSLPSLCSILFEKSTFSAERAIHFMSRFQHLNSFSFRLNDSTAYDVFRALLSNEWQCETVGGIIYVRRKTLRAGFWLF